MGFERIFAEEKKTVKISFFRTINKLTGKNGGEVPVVLELEEARPLPSGEGGAKAVKLLGVVGCIEGG